LPFNERGNLDLERSRSGAGWERAGAIQRGGRCSMTSTFSEQVGKVFVVTHGMRQCLICNALFTREEAAKHAGTACFPKQQSSGRAKLED